MKNKKAFTLGEILTVFIIIGIIATIAMATIKPWEKAYKYAYTKTFNALTVAIYNYMTAGGVSFPEAPETFCKALRQYMNTIDINCPVYSNNVYLGVDPSLKNFKQDESMYRKPNLILTNGAKLWIGSDGNAPFNYEQTIGTSTNNIKDAIKYYIVYVDLNGDRGPNVIAFDKKLPDIVAFLVTDNLVVIPLGYPKVDQRYLSAHIMYPLFEEDETEVEHMSDSMTYYEALVGAYGKGDDGKLVTYGITETYGIEANLSNDSPFKLVEGLDGYYTSAPTFDQADCGDGNTVEELITNNQDSYCSIKIFNYN